MVQGEKDDEIEEVEDIEELPPSPRLRGTGEEIEEEDLLKRLCELEDDCTTVVPHWLLLPATGLHTFDDTEDDPPKKFEENDDIDDDENE